MSADPVRAIADAVLYEGYILWPYRRSALKNQRRFQFGGVYPPAHSQRHPDDRAAIQAEALLSAVPETRISLTVRFLQMVARTVTDPDGQVVDELTVGGERFLSWEEAVERELSVPMDRLSQGVRTPIAIVAGAGHEQLPGGAGAVARSWARLDGHVALSAVAAGDGVVRVTVRVCNTTRFAGAGLGDGSGAGERAAGAGAGAGERAARAGERILRHTFCSTHFLLRADRGEFVSLTDPPAQLAGDAAACRNAGVWPVLVGEPPDRSTILCSPIILEDYPRVASESPGDLFDGGEIDQLLILNILALTDAEQAEMAATDPRAREILERTRALTPEQLMALHGRLTR
ncbi:MAG: hypothetical protein ABSG43_02790 [Solirubrobacteraceae bacterium]